MHVTGEVSARNKQLGRSRGKDSLAILTIVLVAAPLLLWNLDEQYLWQDEAATAVLGERLIRYGRPLAYDGKNLITMDSFAQEDQASVDERSGDPTAAVQYFVERGDFRKDLSWIGHPWGQFLTAGTSLALLGKNTVAARLPFAIAGVATVLLLYAFARSLLKDRLAAVIACLLLVSNTYWILHTRQCRYYALSCFLLMLTVMAHHRWHGDKKRGGLLFVLAAWCWFQVDFGSFWPVISILLTMTAWTTRPNWRPVALVGGALLGAIAPWVWYYELFNRLKASGAPFSAKLLGNIFHLNQFLLPLPVLAVALFLLRSSKARVLIRRFLLAFLLIILTLPIWVSAVAPSYFYRYLVHLTPLAALIAAWVILEGLERLWPRSLRGMRTGAAALAALILIVSPLPSNLFSWLIPTARVSPHPLGLLIRPELAVLWTEVFGHRDDPNRQAIEWIQSRSTPEDEILVNYEDIPFMFYMENPVRGGIPCFRVEDRSAEPRFLVLRRSVAFVHWPVFSREVSRYQWNAAGVAIVDIPFGNNPDPSMQTAWLPKTNSPVLLAERIKPRT